MTTIPSPSGIDAGEALELLQAPSERRLTLFARAAAATIGLKPFACGIVNAKSGLCPENCAFCAQSVHNRAKPPVHGLLEEERLLRHAESLEQRGADRMGIVTSGAGPVAGEFDRLCRTGEKLSRDFNLKICASLGILSGDQGERLKQAGFSRYHHNLETAPSFYPRICSTHAIEPRMQTVGVAAAAGLEVCSGGIFGLGESDAQRVEMFSLLRELPVDCVPVNFLTPVPGTPLENRRPLEPGVALAIIAVLRLMLPDRSIVVCGGRNTTLGRFAALVFSAGANGIMIGDYLTTRGDAVDEDRRLLETLGILPDGRGTAS